MGSQDPRDQRSVRRPNGCGRELWNRSWASPRWRVHTTFQKQAVWGGQHGQSDEEALFSRSPGGRAPPEHPYPTPFPRVACLALAILCPLRTPLEPAPDTGR